jgi:hypothetical protein
VCHGGSRPESPGVFWALGPPRSAAGRAEAAAVCRRTPGQCGHDRRVVLVRRPLGGARQDGVTAHLGSCRVAHEPSRPRVAPPPHQRATTSQQGVRMIAGDRPVPSPWWKPMGSTGVHGQRAVSEPPRRLSAAELAARVCMD